MQTFAETKTYRTRSYFPAVHRSLIIHTSWCRDSSESLQNTLTSPKKLHRQDITEKCRRNKMFLINWLISPSVFLHVYPPWNGHKSHHTNTSINLRTTLKNIVLVIDEWRQKKKLHLRTDAMLLLQNLRNLIMIWASNTPETRRGRWEGRLTDERTRFEDPTHHATDLEGLHCCEESQVNKPPERESETQQRLQSVSQAAWDSNTAVFMHPPPSHTHSHTYYSCFTIYRIFTSLTRASWYCC